MRTAIFSFALTSFSFFLFANQAQAQTFSDFIKVFPEGSNTIELKVNNTNQFLQWEYYQFIPNGESIAGEFNMPVSFVPVAHIGNVVVLQVNVGLRNYFFQKVVYGQNGEAIKIERFKEGETIAMK